MLLAENYPLLNLMWSMFIFFGWVLFIWLLILVYTDVFRRQDIGGWAKTGWVVLTLVLPFIGTFVYLISQSRGMTERRDRDMRRQRAELDDYVRSVATTGSNGADQISQAKELLDSGAITPAEYEAMKRKVLA